MSNNVQRCGPSGPHLTVEEWRTVSMLLYLNPTTNNAGVRTKIAAYLASRELHAQRDPRITDPYDQRP